LCAMVCEALEEAATRPEVESSAIVKGRREGVNGGRRKGGIAAASVRRLRQDWRRFRRRNQVKYLAPTDIDADFCNTDDWDDSLDLIVDFKRSASAFVVPLECWLPDGKDDIPGLVSRQCHPTEDTPLGD